MYAYRFVKFLPYSNRLVMRASNDKLTVVTHSKSPDLSMMAIEFLDILKLNV